MNSWVSGTFTVTCAPARVDRALIAEFLASSYWAEGIPPATVERSLAHSLCFALLEGGRQVGLARGVSDYATSGCLGGVVVLAEYRGRGLAKWLMACVTSPPELQGLRRWVLATRDAHGLYGKFGFTPLKKPEFFMERHDPDIYGGSVRQETLPGL